MLRAPLLYIVSCLLAIVVVGPLVSKANRSLVHGSPRRAYVVWMLARVFALERPRRELSDSAELRTATACEFVSLPEQYSLCAYGVESLIQLKSFDKHILNK